MYLIRIELRKSSILRGHSRLHGNMMRNYIFTHRNGDRFLTLDRKSVKFKTKSENQDPNRRDLTPEEYNEIAADLMLSSSMQSAGIVPVMIKQELPKQIGVPIAKTKPVEVDLDTIIHRKGKNAK